MKKLLPALFILFIAHYSFAQSDLASVSPHKHSFKFTDFKSVADDSTVSGNTENTNAVAMPTFYARRNKKNVELTWQPPTEESKSVFIIEKKSGDDWQTIAYVPCSYTSNDNTPSVYTYTDANTSKTETEYRIKEVIEHGSTRSTREVLIEPETTKQLTASNAGYGKIRFAFKTDDVRDIKIFNDKGQLLREANDVHEKNVQLAVEAAGTMHLLVREQSTGAIATGEVYVR